jgi:hypothetical protein
MPKSSKMVEEKRCWLHITKDGLSIKVYAGLKSEAEVREYFSKDGSGPEVSLPQKMGTLYVMYGSKENPDWAEVFCWDPGSICVEADDIGEGHGLVVEVDGKEIQNTWQE